MVAIGLHEPIFKIKKARRSEEPRSGSPSKPRVSKGHSSKKSNPIHESGLRRIRRKSRGMAGEKWERRLACW